MKHHLLLHVLLWLCMGFLGSPQAQAYALLAHEALIDESWEGQLRPLLLKRYPGTTEAELKEAHAYLYGGAVMPDIGYFPTGSIFFSNLVHYVRTGDFVQNLLSEAQDVREFAFALGFLCHYSADCTGHPQGTNKVVPELFPCAKRKYGNEVNYEQAKKYHSRTEFSFDVFMVANGDFDPARYKDFIGFKISRPLMERAFVKTYGLPLDDVFKRFDMAESVFRFGVRSLMPALTKACWHWKKRDLKKATEPGKTYNRYRVDKKAYRHDHGKPGIRSMGLSFFIVALPKVGPLSVLRFKVPNEEVQRIFRESYEAVLDDYKVNIGKVAKGQAEKITNLNFDTGNATAPGEYELADETYMKLVKALQKDGFAHVNTPLLQHIQAFYKAQNQLVCPKAGSKKARKLERNLMQLEQKGLEGLRANTLD